MKQQIPHQRYLELAEKWLNGTITPAEEKEYAQWFNDFPEDASLNVLPEQATSREAHRQLLLRRINQARRPATPLYLRPVRRLAAAAILLLLAGGAWWYIRKPSPARSPSSPVIVKNDIPPGASGAILVLAGGRTILLDTAGNGVLAAAGGAPVIKSTGSLAFGERSGSPYPETGDPLAYNTLTTPRARQQHVVLPDGTGVWLNAASSIRFPSRFPRDSRGVEVTGEAYFEVANDPARPFHVNIPARVAGGQASVIEVLGTHFNVMAYANESQLRTTLLEGAVRFRGASKSLLLKPGQQGILSAHNELKLLADADTSQAIAWKNGIQAFDSADLHTVMRQVERWYDVEVEYKGAIPSRTYTGNIPRSASLAQLLQLFQVVGIHYIIDAEKKKLIIMP